MNTLAKKYLMRALSMEIKRKPDVQSKIEERVKRGICILDGCTRDIRARGLCDRHRQLFYLRMRQKPTDEDRLEYEETARRLGRILADGEQRSIRQDDPFVDAG